MRTHSLARTFLLAALLWGVQEQGDAQVLNDGFGRYRLTPTSPTPQSFSIGNSFTSGYALDVHGEQMNPSLGNVFKTNADEHLDSYWRMFHGQDEFGQLFHSVGDKQFNINAPQGHLP
jgi:hypothetical protein